MNFASYSNPGGGFIRGMKAQEEALCIMYFQEIGRLNARVYTPSILVDVITTAAPNKTLSLRYKNFTNEQNPTELIYCS